MNIETAERVAKGNKAYYANEKLIKSKFLKKNTKMKIYKKMIRPVVKYSSETWTLTAKDENNLGIFERQIQGKIFGLVNIDSIWRIRNNMEIDKLTLILPRSRSGTVWFYTSTSNKKAARPKLYTKSLTRDLKLMYSRLTLVRISINL